MTGAECTPVYQFNPIDERVSIFGIDGFRHLRSDIFELILGDVIVLLSSLRNEKEESTFSFLSSVRDFFFGQFLSPEPVDSRPHFVPGDGIGSFCLLDMFLRRLFVDFQEILEVSKRREIFTRVYVIS